MARPPPWWHRGCPPRQRQGPWALPCPRIGLRYCIKANISGGTGEDERGGKGQQPLRQGCPGLPREDCDDILKRWIPLVTGFSLFCGFFLGTLATGGIYGRYVSNKSLSFVILGGRPSGRVRALTEKVRGRGFGSDPPRSWCRPFPPVNGCPLPGYRQLYVNVLCVHCLPTKRGSAAPGAPQPAACLIA